MTCAVDPGGKGSRPFNQNHHRHHSAELWSGSFCVHLPISFAGTLSWKQGKRLGGLTCSRPPHREGTRPGSYRTLFRFPTPGSYSAPPCPTSLILALSQALPRRMRLQKIYPTMWAEIAPQDILCSNPRQNLTAGRNHSRPGFASQRQKVGVVEVKEAPGPGWQLDLAGGSGRWWELLLLFRTDICCFCPPSIYAIFWLTNTGFLSENCPSWSPWIERDGVHNHSDWLKTM